MKSKPRVYCNGVDLPEVGAVLLDPHGLTWRVHHRKTTAHAVQLRPTSGSDLKRVVGPEDVDGWEVLG